MSLRIPFSVSKLLVLFLIACPLAWAGSFVTFESGHVRPLALNLAGSRLFAVNTPGSHLEIFNVGADGLSFDHSVPVGMEPVAVAVRNDSEVWVVNHLSDSVSIVDVSAIPPRVVRTLFVGDEPRDIVFAGPSGNRAFITAAHRGQNSPYAGPVNPAEATTPGIGRADVWVFDANNLGPALGGTPLTIVTLFGDVPRALAASPDGSTVYAAVFQSGNQTTSLMEELVCNGGAAAGPCIPDPGELVAPGGLPAPNANLAGDPQFETGLIVKFDGTDWVDELGRSWNDMVRFDLPDQDVFKIDANANPPVQTGTPFSGVGTVLFNMVVHPTTNPLDPNKDKVYVSNTDAVNEVRFEGGRPAVGPGSTITTVQGRLHKTRINILEPGGNVVSRHINKHIDYNVRPAPAGVKDNSLGLPRGIAISGDGNTLYLAAKGSDKVGVFSRATLEDDTFVPSSANHIIVSGGGPAGLVVDDSRNRLYVSTRFDNGISIIDTSSNSETHHYALHNPEPTQVVSGRRFLYDANLTSSNGEAACGSCHVDADLDSLGWDLGDPTGLVKPNPNPFLFGGGPVHPMKGPTTTQTLRGMATHGPMHWRGDRTEGDIGGDPLSEAGAFKEFNVAFEGLVGRTGPLTVPEMQMFTDFILEVLPPPNPIRNLDDSLTADQAAGRTFYFNTPVDGGTCNACHVLDPAQGFFGTNGLSSFEGETQNFKIPHLRNVYTKVGMFGMPDIPFILTGDNLHKGPQIRGYGLIHDGAVDTLFRFMSAALFAFPSDIERRQMEQFILAFDSNLKPVVGQQITLTSSNAATVNPRVDLLRDRAVANDNDLVVKGTIGGEVRGWHRLPAGTFQSDKASEAPLSDVALRALAGTVGQELTYTAVPPGSGLRMGIDRDEDAVLDGDDVCPATADPGQADGENDGVGDLCDNCTAQLNGTLIPDAGGFSQRDTNGDGYGNRCDADLDNSGFTNSLDLGLMANVFFTMDADADLNGDGLVNSLDLGIMSTLFFQSPGPSALAP